MDMNFIIFDNSLSIIPTTYLLTFIYKNAQICLKPKPIPALNSGNPIIMPQVIFSKIAYT